MFNVHVRFRVNLTCTEQLGLTPPPLSISGQKYLLVLKKCCETLIAVSLCCYNYVLLWNDCYAAWNVPSSLVGTQNDLICLSRCGYRPNPGVGIMFDVAWRQTLYCSSWEKNTISREFRQWQGCGEAPPSQHMWTDFNQLHAAESFFSLFS